MSGPAASLTHCLRGRQPSEGVWSHKHSSAGPKGREVQKEPGCTRPPHGLGALPAGATPPPPPEAKGAQQCRAAEPPPCCGNSPAAARLSWSLVASDKATAQGPSSPEAKMCPTQHTRPELPGVQGGEGP